MRVICISGVKAGSRSIDVKTGKPKAAATTSEIYEGEVYTVVLVENHNGKDFYSLAERNIIYGYAATKFIPCSDIDEMELVNQKPEPCHA